MLPARLDLSIFVGRSITEVIVGKPHLQLVAGVASRQVAKVIAGECLILEVDVLFSRFSWSCRATLHELSGRHLGYTPPLSQSDPKFTSRRIDRVYPWIAIQ